MTNTVTIPAGEYAALKRGAERFGGCGMTPPFRLCVREAHYLESPTYIDGEELDAAIDAAIKESNP